MTTRRRALPLTEEQLLDRIRREYRALPGLRLTPVQAGRLWGLEPATCVTLLFRLTQAGFLVRAVDGSFLRADVDRLIAAAASSPESSWSAA